MSTITLTQAIEQRDAYLEASKKIAEGKKVEMNGRRLEMEDLDQVMKSLKYWEGKVSQLSQPKKSSGIKMYTADWS